MRMDILFQGQHPKVAETKMITQVNCRANLVKTFLKRSKMEFPKVVLMMSMKEERPNTRQEPSKAANPKKRMGLMVMAQTICLLKCLAKAIWKHLNNHMPWV